jgi:hypothetical protein
MTTKHPPGSAAALRDQINWWRSSSLKLEDKLAERDATIAELRADVSVRDKTCAKHDTAMDVRTLAGIIRNQTERIELLEAAVLGITNETPNPAVDDGSIHLSTNADDSSFGLRWAITFIESQRQAWLAEPIEAEWVSLAQAKLAHGASRESLNKQLEYFTTTLENTLRE